LFEKVHDRGFDVPSGAPEDPGAQHETLLVRAPGGGELPAGEERDDGIGGVTVEILPSPFVHGGGSGVGVASCDLHVAQRGRACHCCPIEHGRSCARLARRTDRVVQGRI
jgi:hypothetical protein